MSYLWSAFLDVNSGRSMGFSGPNPISFQELKYWMELTGVSYDPWEIEAIKSLDALYLRTINNG